MEMLDVEDRKLDTERREIKERVAAA